MKKKPKLQIQSIEDNEGNKLAFKRFELKNGEKGEFMIDGRVFELRFVIPNNETIKIVKSFKVKEK